MINVRRSSDRGKTEFPWLHSLHTFSFGEYYDPLYMGFESLRVINEDTVLPSSGFDKHPHRDMEIISYVISGALEHQDSLGTGSIIRPGEIQRMTAGSGVLHSEYNPSNSTPVHFLQIWIIPSQKGLPPSYEQKAILKQKNNLVLIGAPKPEQNAVLIHQNVDLYVGEFTEGSTYSYQFNEQQAAWIQMIKGQIKVGDEILKSGDGASFEAEPTLHLHCIEEAEFLLFIFR